LPRPSRRIDAVKPWPADSRTLADGLRAALHRSGATGLAGLVGGLLVGFIVTAAWPVLPGVGRAALLLGLALAAWTGWRQVQQLRRRDGIELDLQSERLRRLERRAQQFDEAEHLVDLGSFDWYLDRNELHWSEQHYRLWGYEPGTVLPTLALFERHVHPDDRDRVSGLLQQALQGGVGYDCTHRVQRSDGSVRVVRARGAVTFDDQGVARRMIGAVLDITERVQVEDSLRLHAFVLDAITDPVGVIDADTRYRLANRAWLAVNGRTQQQTLGRSIDEIYTVVVSAERRQMVLDCLAGKPVTSVRSLSPSPLNAGRRIETRYFPFHDPAVSWHGAVMISRDVTDDESVRLALATGVDQLELTLNTIGDAIFATDAAGPDEPVLFANRQLRELWQIDQPDDQPLTARTIIDHAARFFRDPTAEVARIRAIVASNEDTDERLDLNDGRVLMRRCRATVRQPRTVRVWAFRDITVEARALQALADSEQRQRRLLAAFPGYIWVIDDQERLVYLNPAAAAVYRPQAPDLGSSMRRVFGPEVADRVRPAVQRALAGETLSLDWHRPSVSGRSPDDLLIKLAPGQGPDGRGQCVAFGIDISSLKQAEAALVAARDEAERANQAKTQFLSSMSHELRTPLNAVIGFSQLLERNADGNLNPQQVRQLGEIRRAGGHLLDLINGLLDLARIEAGHTRLDLVAVPVDPVLDECLQLVQPMVQRQGLTLVPPEPGAGAVMGDRLRLKQVLLNLLSNAIKYNRPGGHVTLGWQTDAQGLCVEVQDEGPGLSTEAQARLFQPFERLGAEGSDVVGTGIGLALSRQLVHLMKGEIGVRSQPGQGSCFWFRLPRAAAGPDAAVATLLYVDDNPVNLALAEGLFEDHATLQLRTSADPRAALASLREQPVQLLLLDLHMPDLDGFELFAALQADPATRGLPVVAVSADDTAATLQRCHALGFVDHVAKPIDAERLFDAVGRALQVGRTRAALPPDRPAAQAPVGPSS
jgi:PAS domain S-box-containing protein